MEDKDIFENQWEQGLPPENEMKLIRRTIRKRNWRIIAISVVLAAAILLISVFGIIPAVEQLYWNADEYSYGRRSDLEATLHAYTDLFNPDHQLAGLHYRHTGFASYDLELNLLSRNWQEYVSIGGTLICNQLSIDQMIENTSVKNHMFWHHYQTITEPEQNIIEAVRGRLEELPKYIRLEANVSFREDITMEELMAFREEYSDLQITWVAVRVTEPSKEWIPLCGMSPFIGGSVFDGMYQDYLYFDVSNIREPAHLEQHFKSLLQYSADQVELGRGIAPYDEWDIYQNALDYVQENGVKSYGVIATASPELLLELMNDARVIFIDPVDGWIDLCKYY